MKKFIKVIVLAMAFVLVFATLASCGKSIAGIEKKAEKAGYTVVATEKTIVITDKEDVTKTASAMEYDDAKLAKEAYDAAKEALELVKDAYEAAGVNYEVKRSGKIVIAGDAEVIKKVW